MERAARHLRLLSETVALVTSSLDLVEVTRTVAHAVARALETDACFVYVYDEAAGELVLMAVYGTTLATATAPPRMKPGEGLTGYAAAMREPVAIAADGAPRSPLQGVPEPARGALPVAARGAHGRQARAPARAR